MLSLCHRIIHQISWLHLLVALVAAQNSSNAQPEQDNLFYNFDPPMATLAVILVCAFLLIGFVSMCIHPITEGSGPLSSIHQRIASTGHAPACGLDVSVIETFPVLLYSSVKELKMGKGTLECAVCLSEFGEDESLRLLPKCNHVFHPACIDLWLSAHVTCPVCRAELTPGSGEPPKIVDSNTELNRELSRANVGTEQELNHHVVIDVNENCRRGMPIQGTMEESRVPRAGILVKFSRSHSTGHTVLIPPGDNIERYTLRLPEEIRRQILTPEGLKRTRSYNVIFPREGSSRKGYRDGGGEESSGGKWIFFMAAPFVSSTESVMSQKVSGGDEMDRI
ncbi:hypothetical protein SLE2022_367230 [Rubroshorea leprosula]